MRGSARGAGEYRMVFQSGVGRLAAVLAAGTALWTMPAVAQVNTGFTFTGDYLTDETFSSLIVGVTGTGTSSFTGASNQAWRFGNSVVLGLQSTGDGTLTIPTGFVTVGGVSEQTMIVGDLGRGRLDVSGTGNLLINGYAGATDPNAPFLAVGRRTGSTGTVNVGAGGLLRIADNSSSGGDDGLSLGGTGNHEGGSGRVEVNGTNARLQVLGNTAYMNVGRNGTAASGTLVVSNGGNAQITASDTGTAFLGIGRGGATGTVSVLDSSNNATATTVLGVQGALAVVEVGADTAGSNGLMNVGAGAVVQAMGNRTAGSQGLFRIADDGASGTINVNGGRIVVGSFGSGVGSAVMSVGTDAGATGRLAVNAGSVYVGDVILDGAQTTAESELHIGENAGSVGVVNITGGFISVASHAPGTLTGITVGNQGAGSLTITGQGSVNVTAQNGAVGGVAVGAEPGSTGTVLVSGSGARLFAGNFLGIGALPTDHTLSTVAEGGTGQVVVTDGGYVQADRVEVGVANPTGSVLRALSVHNGGRIQAQTVTAHRGSILTGDGTISGQVILNGGILAAGTSSGGVGTLTIANGLRVDSGVLQVKVDGRAAGQYDVYAVTGAAEFNGGTVLVVFADSFTPAQGDRYNVVTTTGTASGASSVATTSNREDVEVQFVSAEDGDGFDVIVVGGSTTTTSPVVERAEQTVAATAEEQTRSVVRTVVAAVSSRVREATMARRTARTAPANGAGLETGLAAGNGGNRGVSVWVDGGVSRLISDPSSGKFEGYSRNVLVGADYTLGDFVFGAAAGLERSTLALSPNDGQRSSTGVSFIGYAGYLIDDVFSADVQIANGRLSNRLRETRGTVTDAGDFTSSRLILASNLNAAWTSGNWTVIGTLGASFSRERFDSYTLDSGASVSPDSVYLGQLRAGAEISYDIGGYTPYVSASVEQDVRSSEGGDRNGAVIGAGLRTQLSDDLTAGVYSSAQLFRSNEQNYSLSANLRYAF